MASEKYEEEFKELLNKKSGLKYFIRKSNATYKIKGFMRKSIDSLKLVKYVNNSNEPAKLYWTITICYYSMLYMAKAAILTKNYETDDHYSTQIALGYLLIPDELKKEDLKLLEEAHKIFEEEYVEYFEDARKESSISRYSPTKVYQERRVKEILNNAETFIAKIRLLIE